LDTYIYTYIYVYIHLNTYMHACKQIHTQIYTSYINTYCIHMYVYPYIIILIYDIHTYLYPYIQHTSPGTQDADLDIIFGRFGACTSNIIRGDKFSEVSAPVHVLRAKLTIY